MSQNVINALVVLVILVMVGAGYLLFGRSSCVELPNQPPCVRVLFIGNSFTHMNALPNIVRELARSGDKRLQVDMIAPGGRRLREHAADPLVHERLAAEAWDYVVLQEQSQIPSLTQMRRNEMLPAAQALAKRIRERDAQPLLFMTWGRRMGWPEGGFADYSAMQQAITNGYREVSRELRIPVMPIGEAWRSALAEDLHLQLWDADGIHPSKAGSYLAACVIYASLFNESPERLSYRAGLAPELAQRLQRIAGEVVLRQR
jgi:hypothetical protein